MASRSDRRSSRSRLVAEAGRAGFGRGALSGAAPSAERARLCAAAAVALVAALGPPPAPIALGAAFADRAGSEVAGAGDRIELRGTPATAAGIEGRIVAVDDDGVAIVERSGASRTIPWDRIRIVDSAEWAREIERRMPMATDLWRARSRIERGDTLLAEPLLEAHARLMRDARGETALLVAEGLLRCRLARGEHALAIEPALRAAALRRTGAPSGLFADLPPVLDERTGLCRQLPPVVLEGPAVATMRAAMESIESAAAGSDPVLAAMASLYRRSVVIRSDGSIVPPSEPRGADDVDGSGPGAAAQGSAASQPGVALLRLLLATVDGDPAAREAARRRLGDASQQLPGFSLPWAGFFNGLSLLADEAGQARRRGIVAVLSVPALEGRRRSWLAGVALAVAARALRDSGDEASATTLLRELESDHPHHPIRGASPGASAARSPGGGVSPAVPAWGVSQAVPAWGVGARSASLAGSSPCRRRAPAAQSPTEDPA